MAETATLTTHLLRYEDVLTPAALESIRARLFGVVLERALCTVEHYKSDLYHDAQWIAKHVNGEKEFYYSVRDTGTHIGEDISCVQYGAERLFHLKVECADRGRWQVLVTEVRPGG